MKTFNRQSAQSGKKACEAGHTFEPRYPSGEGIGATITVRGPESQAARDILRQQIATLHARDLAAKRTGRDADPMSIDQIEAQAIDMAVAYTIRWEGFEDGDQPLAPTEANFRSIYTEHAWIRRQVIEEAQDLGNFVKPASASLSPTPLPSSAST